jgi:hypothetical protein
MVELDIIRLCSEDFLGAWADFERLTIDVPLESARTVSVTHTSTETKDKLSMSNQSKKGPATIIPAMRYRSAPAAIEWLCQAFGFEKHLVVSGENGAIAHAQLTWGNGSASRYLGSSRIYALEQRLPALEACGHNVLIQDLFEHQSKNCQQARA